MTTEAEVVSFRYLPWAQGIGTPYKISGSGSNSYANVLESRLTKLATDLERTEQERDMALDEGRRRVAELERQVSQSRAETQSCQAALIEAEKAAINARQRAQDYHQRLRAALHHAEAQAVALEENARVEVEWARRGLVASREDG